jgi:hypothetical protein
MWNEMVYIGDVGGSGFRESGEERVKCKKEGFLRVVFGEGDQPSGG